MTAIFQLEVDRKRLTGYESPISDRESVAGSFSGHRTIMRLLRSAMLDTIDNGGTFVLVVTPDKITAVQRKEAEHP